MSLTNAEKKRLEWLFSWGSRNVVEHDEHWIYGGEDGALSYCFECAEKEVAKLLAAGETDIEVDGGWGTDGDYTPWCETCDKLLSNSYTQYACEEEVGHFLDYSFDPTHPHDCYSMEKVIGSSGWNWPPGNFEQYYSDLNRLCREILENNFWIMPDNEYRHMWQ